MSSYHDVPITYEATVDADIDKFNPVYVWSAINGVIVSGQGTRKIAVRLNDDKDNLTVTLEIKGLPSHCTSISKETLFIDREAPPVKLAEFRGPLSAVAAARFDAIVDAARRDPNSRVYVIISGGRRNRARSIEAKRSAFDRRAGHELSKDARGRVTYKISDRMDDRVIVWLVPAGTRDPEP